VVKVEFLYKPVELFGKFEALTGGTPTPVTTASSVTSLKVDQYGRLMVVGPVASYGSTIGVNPVFIAGADSAGSIVPLDTTSGTIRATLAGTQDISIAKTRIQDYRYGIVTGSTTMWTPASGKSIHLIGMIVSMDTAGYVELTFDTSTFSVLHFNEKKTVPLSLPFELSGGTDIPIKANASGGTAYITLIGHED